MITQLELRGKREAYSMADMILELVEEITLNNPYDWNAGITSHTVYHIQNGNMKEGHKNFDIENMNGFIPIS